MIIFKWPVSPDDHLQENKNNNNQGDGGHQGNRDEGGEVGKGEGGERGYIIVSVWPVFLPKEASNLGESSSGKFSQPNKSIKTW